MRSASASAGARGSFDIPSSRWPASGSGSAGMDYRMRRSWRGRPRRPDTSESALSDDGEYTPASPWMLADAARM
jgi:hypothetical protein